ncbi:MAG: diaminopimelate decarboxylase [Acidimicrobiales bacterium]
MPRSLLPDSADTSPAGNLSVGGVDLLELCAEVGTPVFVYDSQQLRSQCRLAKEAWQDSIAYASKAFWCLAMARLVAEEGLSVDVSTAGELHVALRAGVPPERLVVHGNNKSDAEVARALEVGAGRIVVDSFHEIERLEDLATRMSKRPAVWVRVTPGIEAHTHHFVRTGQEDSKFGFSLASGAATDAAERVRRPGGPLRLAGLHTHIGSQIFDLDPYRAAIAVLAPLVRHLEVEELCIGGGLGVAYVTGEEAPPLADWAEAVRKAAIEAGLPAQLRISAEPGRALVARAGLTCYTVGTIKVLPGIRTYVSVDGGMSDNPRPVLYGSGYEAFLPREWQADRPLEVRVVGKHCESGDVVVADARLPADLALGDVLATPVTGAYGHSMASNYNKVPRPPVVFAEGGRYRVVVRRESLDDLLGLDA